MSRLLGLDKFSPQDFQNLAVSRKTTVEANLPFPTLLELKAAFARFIVCVGFNAILLWTFLMRSIQLLLLENTAVISDSVLGCLVQ